MPAPSTGLARVTINSPQRRVDVALPDGVPLAELLPELTLAQRWDLTVEELVRNVHTHPTLSEALQETFHGLSGKMINMPERAQIPENIREQLIVELYSK